MYHGSPTGGIEQFEPRSHPLSKEPVVFGTPDERLALAMSTPSTDDDLAVGYETNRDTGDEQFYIDELSPGKLDLLRRKAYLYSLPSDTFSEEGLHPELMKQERVSYESMTPSDFREVKNVLKELQSRKDVLIRGYDDIPEEKFAAAQPSGINKEEIIRQLAELNHPGVGVAGGAAMVLRGLRDDTSDIDADASPEVFNELHALHGSPETEVTGMGTRMYNNPGTHIDLHESAPSGEPMEGVVGSVSTPEELLPFYENLNSPKDQQWIKALREKLDVNVLSAVPHAAFVLAPHEGGFAATTRAADKGEEGKIGLPGGKLDPNESPRDAAIREAAVAGGDVSAVADSPFHTQLVDDSLGLWYEAAAAKQREAYKEQGRITPVGATYEDLVASGYGNDAALAAYKDDDVHVLSAIPPGSRELVNEHGLLSSEALLSNPEVLKAVLANREGTDWEESEEEFRANVAEKLKDKFWGTSMQGPSVFFGEPDPDKITDKHPMSKLKSEIIKINLSKLLRDHPDTRISGTELVPYDPEGPEHQGDKRHKDIDLDKVREYAAMDPKELWKHYNNPEGTRYASDVPHAQIITPSGIIPSEYIK